MQERCSFDAEDSDATYFRTLLLFSEMIIKLSCSFFVTAMEDSSDKHRYQIIYKLIRADGVGEWINIMENIITGPYQSYLVDTAKYLTKDFSQKCTYGWQNESFKYLINVQQKLNLNFEKKEKVSVIDIFKVLVYLRNKTQGHGAQLPSVLGECSTSLRDALNLIVNNICIFQFEWCFLKQNISKKYRVSKISDSSANFDYLKSKTNYIFSDGIYIFFDTPRKNNLVYSDAELQDFYIANGGCNNKQYEALSYITGKTRYLPADDYLAPVEALPKSITSGKLGLDVQGNVWTNLPQAPCNYICREEIEKEIISIIYDNRNPVITLHGRGGIGKTSTLLNVLHKLSETESSFESYLWFSARDLDLFESGPKIVAPEVLDKRQIVEYYISLMKPDYKFKNYSEKEQYFITNLQSSEQNAQLFIFDNFETMKNPLEVYNWLNIHIRLPNKIIITTRFRTFKGDYPIEIKGMTKEQTFNLIDSQCKLLGLIKYINIDNKESIFIESDGHPYIIKMLLNGYSKTKCITDITRKISSRNDVLEALFERTFLLLSEAAKKVYITLALWRSPVSEIALISVLESSNYDGLDVDDAISELVNFSFIERTEGKQSPDAILRMPKASYHFAQGKIKTSQYLYEAKEDIEILRLFGVSNGTNFNLEQRFIVFFHNIIQRMTNNHNNYKKFIDILLFICQKVPQLYFYAGVSLLSKIPDEARNFLIYYIENNNLCEECAEAWIYISNIDKEKNDSETYIYDLVRAGMIYCEFNIDKVGDVAKKISYYISSNNIDVYLGNVKKNIYTYAEAIREKIKDIEDENIYSQCAWLYLNIGEKQKAKELVNIGISIYQNNKHLIGLKKRLDFE